MNLAALIPFLVLLKDSGVLSPAPTGPRVHFAKPFTLPTLTSEEAGKLYVAGVGEKGAIMSMSKWLKGNPGKNANDYYKYVAAFT